MFNRNTIYINHEESKGDHILSNPLTTKIFLVGQKYPNNMRQTQDCEGDIFSGAFTNRRVAVWFTVC